MHDQDDNWLQTIGLIGLNRAGVGTLLPILREACGGFDLAGTVAEGRLKQRGRLRSCIDYRVRGNHIVVSLRKLRIEFDFIRPKAFSAFLLQRHMELNRKLKKFFPQYLEISLAR